MHAWVHKETEKKMHVYVHAAELQTRPTHELTISEWLMKLAVVQYTYVHACHATT
jgi:hypothetical protein